MTDSEPLLHAAEAEYLGNGEYGAAEHLVLPGRSYTGLTTGRELN